MSHKQIEVSIFNQTFRLACAPENETNLREAVKQVDTEMNQIAHHSQIRGTDRIAVMAAISLASKLLELQNSIHQGKHIPIETVTEMLQKMNAQLDASLVQHETHEPAL